MFQESVWGLPAVAHALGFLNIVSGQNAVQEGAEKIDGSGVDYVSDVNGRLGLVNASRHKSITTTGETFVTINEFIIMTRKNLSDEDRNQRELGNVNVWVLGSSIGSLASAVFLIRDAKIPAPQIHLLESREHQQMDCPPQVMR
ncbi:67 kDa myosin-cross-reactive antigen family protein [Penicillium cosmopolitanum]|uniref:67 kDa myosin-cross-reactive antigen family protein n=1 Tax=Penicillium cosmopolitanum TaxID=1131564 RepID=A0A9X0BF86_9EURO|nr:67 kDa myosin-cross-reactive antigen family protein [Penicillium cosmopolitanum]KAJ5414935.1 67 kDa myosin-cross-reactive antigen family protein [Penicillium cosmopolitanum]